MLKKIGLFFLFFFTIFLSGCSDLFKEPPDHIEYYNPTWSLSGNIVYIKFEWSNKEGEDGDNIVSTNLVKYDLVNKKDTHLLYLGKRSFSFVSTGINENEIILYEDSYYNGVQYLNYEINTNFNSFNEYISYISYSPNSDYLAIETESGVKLYNKQFEKQKELTNITNLSGWKYADEIIGIAEIDAGKVLRYITKENEIVKEILISSNVQVLQYYPDGKWVLCQLDENPI
ncbi:MAG: hypothetical protein GY710_21015, partial [Desulfobacteraceae bacterium]|nr:hypothetical protein [Desulfobacteraceae bacterium]